MAGAHGESLLDWLDRYTFPPSLVTAMYPTRPCTRRSVREHAPGAGTTSALVFGVSFEPAVRALFEAMRQERMAGASGVVWMDREGPEPLLQGASACYDSSLRLLNEFGSSGALRYAVLPRFAPSCSGEMLEAAEA